MALNAQQDWFEPVEVPDDPVDAAEVDESEHVEPLPPSERIAEAAVGFAAVTLLTVLGASMFFAGSPLLTLAPAAGIAAALAVRSRRDAALAAGAGTIAGTWVTSAVSRLEWNVVLTWMPAALVLAVLAGLVAVGACWLLERREDIESLAAVVALALVVSAGVTYAGTTVTAVDHEGSSLARMLTTAPKIDDKTPDEALYSLYVQRLWAGEPYYTAVGSVLAQADAARPGRVDLTTPLSFRPPTLYLLMSALPRDGRLLAVLTLACGLMAAVAAFSLAGRFVAPSLALAGATGVFAYYASLSSRVQLFGTELWAGAFGLVALALLAAARDPRSSRRAALVWAAAAAALAGALFRELGAAFLLLGLAVTLLDAEDRKARLWLPWVVGLGVGGVALFAHWQAAAPVIASLHAQPTVPFAWFNPDGLGAVAAAARIARHLETQDWAAWALIALGAVGALAAPRERGMRIALAATVIGGIGILAFLYPPGEAAGGLPPSYWADIAAPTVLACVPLAFALLPGARRQETDEAA